MYRCVIPLMAAMAIVAPAANAQVQRNFPPNALRGVLVVTQSPDVTLNGQAARMSPGSRLRGDTNLLLQPASVTGTKLLVHYTVAPDGQLMDVWILNSTEAANKPWPTTAAQAAAWSFDQASQTWTKQ
ncbi:hypothetical protein [Pelomonas sp. KK5]|uniref:hypothetical protein n=1 Tax=Pelomonas sp. KK5 TaxID=1855730 RepID=UPI00097BDA74|nr:hypothetical protein [Pelomonas sp. KK5]